MRRAIHKHRFNLLFFCLLPALCFLLPAGLYADDEPFTYPSNEGFTGIMEIPTARVMKENHYRVGISQIHPFRFYFITLTPFKNLEINGRVTESIGIKASDDPKWSGYGNDKDKAIDIKYKFIAENKFLPAVSIGFMDPVGTRVYASQYLVASKQLYPFDFTLGLGNGRLGKTPLQAAGEDFKFEIFQDPVGWLKDSQFFWGIQWQIAEKYAAMFEYNPIQYHKQRGRITAKYFQDPVPSQYNYGIRWKPYKWAEIDMSYQRGEEFGINLSVDFDIGQPLIPVYDVPYKEKDDDKNGVMNKRLIKALNRSGFSSIGVLIDRDEVWIRAQNDKYFYSTKAIGVIAKLVHEIAPAYTQNIHITLTDNGIPVLEISVLRSDIAELLKDKLTPRQFFYLSGIHTATGTAPDIPVEHRNPYEYGIKPSLQTFLNDPSGFFKYRLGAEAWVSFKLWKGGAFIVGPGIYPLNNISSVNEPLSNAVRTDIVDYQKQRFSLPRLMLEQVNKWDGEVYGRLSGGYLEIEYAGLDGEIAKPFRNGRFLVGFGGTLAKKRDPDSVLAFKDDDRTAYYTAFLNTRLNVPELDLTFDAKTGRFLGGDFGSRFSVSKFINGVVLTAWYSVTNTSVFKDQYNRGYHDKGIALSIPFRLFSGSDSKRTFNYSLSPWTRDVAQDIDHYNPLFDFIGRNLKIFLDRDRNMLYK